MAPEDLKTGDDLTHLASELKEFAACTNYIQKDGRLTISCKLGLWSVTGDLDDLLIREAFNYFCLYKDDGEYASIIGGKIVTEKMEKRL